MRNQDPIHETGDCEAHENCTKSAVDARLWRGHGGRGLGGEGVGGKREAMVQNGARRVL